MARARNIKPGLFKNEVLVELPVFCRLLFIGLWTLADREGRLEDRPKRIKLELFPYDNEDTDAAIQALADSGFIERYESNGFKVIQIVNFIKHQAPHGTEKDSKLPDTLGYLTVHERNKSGCSTGVKQKISVKLTENNVNPPLGNIELTVSKRPDSPNPDSPNPEEKKEAIASVTGKPAAVAVAQPICPADDLINLYHELMPLNPPVKVINDGRRKAIRARWKEAALLTCKPFGYDNRQDGILAWRRFFEVCAESEFLTGRAKPTPGKPPFVADIDFLFSPSGFVKCLENKFHREAA